MLGATTSVLISLSSCILDLKLLWQQMKKNLTAANCFFFRETGERCKVGVVVVSPTFLEHEVSLPLFKYRFHQSLVQSYEVSF